MIAARAVLAIVLLMAAGTAASSDDPVLAPPDGALPPALRAVRADLQRIVSARDLAALRAHIREDTTLSFGGDTGPQGFDALWAHNPAATQALWRELEAILALPGVASREEGRDLWCAPYVFCLPSPAEIDVFDAQVVLGRDVALHAQPDERARVLTRLDHAVVTRIDDETAMAASWMRVRLASGQAGFIAAHRLRSPIDYRFSIVGEGKGTWSFQYFVAGD
jgi:hypothetical protein